MKEMRQKKRSWGRKEINNKSWKEEGEMRRMRGEGEETCYCGMRENDEGKE